MSAADSSGDEVDVTVVVVSYNSARVLPGFLETLPAAMAGIDDWRLVVVDNDSGDGSLHLAARLAPEAISVPMGRNAGYAAGLNAGFRQLPGARAVLVCNPDVRLGAGSVAALVRAAAGQRVGIVVPLLLDHAGRHRLSLRREPTLGRAIGEALLGGRAARYPALGETVADPAAYARRSEADWATGAVLLLTRECLDAVGPWDESYFLYSEETDFALRARDQGFRLVLEPEATATHIEGDSKVSPRLWSLLSVNRVRLYGRRHGTVATAAFWLAVLVREALRSPLGAPHRAAVLALLTAPLRRRPWSRPA